MTTPRTFLPDVNVLVALTNSTHVHHTAAHRWLAALDPPDRWATTPLTESALVRLTLNPVVVGRAVPVPEALRVLRELRAQPGHTFVPDDSSVARPEITVDGLAGSRQVTDLHLVNLAAASGCVLATFDSRLPTMLVTADRGHVQVLTD